MVILQAGMSLFEIAIRDTAATSLSCEAVTKTCKVSQIKQTLCKALDYCKCAPEELIEY
jgi:hypothetical protein